MIEVPERKEAKAGESTIALINVVFLMLIFFLISGTLVPPIDKALKPVSSEQEQAAELENMLSVRADGETYAADVVITPEAYFEAYSQNPENTERPIRVFPDHELPAAKSDRGDQPAESGRCQVNRSRHRTQRRCATMNLQKWVIAIVVSMVVHAAVAGYWASGVDTMQIAGGAASEAASLGNSSINTEIATADMSMEAETIDDVIEPETAEVVEPEAAEVVEPAKLKRWRSRLKWPLYSRNLYRIQFLSLSRTPKRNRQRKK